MSSLLYNHEVRKCQVAHFVHVSRPGPFLTGWLGEPAGREGNRKAQPIGKVAVGSGRLRYANYNQIKTESGMHNPFLFVLFLLRLH